MRRNIKLPHIKSKNTYTKSVYNISGRNTIKNAFNSIKRNPISVAIVISIVIGCIAIILALVSPVFSYGATSSLQSELDDVILTINDVIIPALPPTRRRGATAKRIKRDYPFPLSIEHFREVYINASEYYHRGEILSLRHLFDVTLDMNNVIADNSVLGYDQTSGKWTAQISASGTLANLTDVQFNQTHDSVLYYDSSSGVWTGASIPEFFDTYEDEHVLNNFMGVANPTTQDDSVHGFSKGSLWITQGTDACFICVDTTEGAAIWKRIDLYEASVTSFHIQDGTIAAQDMDSSYRKRFPSGVAALDPFGKLYSDQLPDFTFSDVTVVPDISARDAIIGSLEGHIAVVENANEFNQTISYIYDGVAWVQMQASAGVTLVNGYNGNVQLSTEDIPETPSALYYTDVRVSANSDVLQSVTHSGLTSGNPHMVTALDINLDLVPNLKQNLAAVGAPTANDDISQQYSVGSTWIVPSMDCIFKCTSNALGAAVWVRLDLPDGSVTNAKLGIEAVQAQNIHHDAVTTIKITDGAVTTPKLASEAVTTSKIASNAITTSLLADNSVVSSKLATAAVSTDSLQDASVTMNKISDSAVDTSKLINNAVTTDKVVNGAITSDKIADGSVAAVDLVSEYQKGVPLGLASLDPSGTIYPAQLPPISVVSVSIVANITERNELTAQEGDFVIVQDADNMGHAATFVYATSGWVELEFNALVKSVNGKLDYVMLSTDDIPEGSNEYFTQFRVSQNSDVTSNSAHSALTSGNPHNIQKSDLSLDNVENTLNTVHATLNPSTIDDSNAGYTEKSIWINLSTGGVFMCVDDSAGAAQWQQLDLADLSVTASKIDTDAVRSTHILDGEVGASDIDSNEVQERITGTCDTDKHVIAISSTGSVLCSNAVAANTVGANQIIDGSVYTSELSDNAVTGPKIADNAINTAHIIDGTIAVADVDISEIQKRVVGACLAAGSHMSSVTESGGVTCDTSVADDAVGSNQIQDGSIATADYGDATISLAKLQTGSVNSAKILDDTIAEVDMSGAYKKRVANGVAALDGTGKLYIDQMPVLGTTVFVVSNYTERDALSGVASGDTCIVNDTSETFIYDGSIWILVPLSVITDTDELPEGSTHLYYTESRVSLNSDVVSNTAHVSITAGNPHGITKETLGLGFVNNIKNWIDTVDPTVNDDIFDAFVVGSYWINSVTSGAFICGDNTLGAAQWKRIDLYPASVGTTELQANSVTSLKIATNAVGVDEIDTSAVQRRVASSCSSGSQISAIAIDGTVTCDSTLVSNSVGSAQITDGSITSDDLSSGSVTSVKIANNAIGSTHIADGSIKKIDVDSTEIQERVVGTCSAGSHITAVSQAGGVTCDSSVASNVVSSANIVDGSIIADDLASSSVTLGKLASGSVQNSNLVDDTITEAKMSSAYKRGVANGIPTLNAFGQVPSNQLPSLAISSMHVVATIIARDALSVQEGDLAKVTANGQTYIWDGSAWIQISVAGAVDSVNGYSGTVALDSDDIGEGSANLYFTNGRVSANSDVIANKAHSEVTSGNPHNLQKSDLLLGNVQNTKHNYGATSIPSVSDDVNSGYTVGSTWLNTATNKYYICVDATASSAIWIDISIGDTTDHGSFSGLLDDDHTQYALLSGRGTGQTLIGGTTSADHLILQSTSNIARGFVKTNDPMIINDAGYGNTYNYALSLQSGTSATWLEILNNEGADKGAFFGVNMHKFELWNYDGGPIQFYTHLTPTQGTLRFVIENNGDIRITNLGSGIVKSSATGILSVESQNTAYNKAFGTIAGSVSEGNHGHTSTAISDFSTAVDARITLQKGANNGLATLGPSGKIPASQLDLDGLDYQGQWNAATNTPTITSGVGTKGYFYIVSTAGSTLVDGLTDWVDNDWIIFNGATWDKADHTDRVNSVCGFIGDVTLTVSCLTDAGNVVTRNTGPSSGNVPKVGTGGLGVSEVVVTNGAQNLESETKGSAFNKAFGTTAGSVAEGNHQHTDLEMTGYIELADISSPSNAGAAKGRLYKKVGDDGLWWKPDAAGVEVDLTDLGPTGEVNTATNIGTGGVDVYKQKTGVSFEFKSIAAGSSRVSINDDTGNNEIDIDVVEANVDHDELSGYIANEHINHASVSISSGSGLTGGGAITASRTLSLDVNGLIEDTSPDASDDFLLSYDVSAGAHKKVLIDNLDGFVRNTGNENIAGVKTFTDTVSVSSIGAVDNLILDKTTSTTHWTINAGRIAFFDNWLLFKNSAEGGDYTFAISNNGAFRGKDGSAGAPTYTFDQASNYGMSYDGGANKGLVLSTEGHARLRIEDDGTLSVAGTTTYETLVTSDDDIPNKKYVDDAVAAGGGALSIDELSDVDTTTSTPSVGDHLEWDGSNWVPATPSGGGNIIYYEITGIGTAETESDSFGVLDDMSYTPPAGTYQVTFSSSGNCDSVNRDIDYGIFKAGTLIAHTERFMGYSSGLRSYELSLYTQGVVTVTGSQTITIQVRTSGGKFTAHERSMFLLKLA